MDNYISNTLEMFLVYILVFQIQKAGDDIINQHIVQKSVTKISPKMLLSGAVGGGKCPQTPIDFPNQRPKTNFIRETGKCLVEKLQRVFYIGPKAALTRPRDVLASE